MVLCVRESRVGNNSRYPFKSIGQEQAVGEVYRLGARPEGLFRCRIVVRRCSLALEGESVVPGGWGMVMKTGRKYNLVVLQVYL